MIKKKLLIILFVLGVNTSIYSQIDTTLFNTITKLKLLTEVPAENGHILDKNIVDKILCTSIPVSFLQSSGFVHFIFISIQPKDLNMKSDSIVFFTNCKSYILAIDTLSFESYRISGFKENDILNLLMQLNRESYHHLGNAKTFSKYYSIEGVDLNCLYQATKRNSRDTTKYPCLKYCREVISVY
jgi:hypothetical protein